MIDRKVNVVRAKDNGMIKIEAIPKLKQLFSFPSFRNSFVKASSEIQRRFNTIHIVNAYASVEILEELIEIKLLLKQALKLPETDEEREARIDKEVEEAKIAKKKVDKEIEDEVDKEIDKEDKEIEDEIGGEKEVKPKKLTRGK